METVTYIAHHGVLGQKWGVRRYQNEDGSLTVAGRKRYAHNEAHALNKMDREHSDHQYRANVAANNLQAATRRRAKLLDKGYSGSSPRVTRLNRLESKQRAIMNSKNAAKDSVAEDISEKVRGLESDGYKVSTKPTIRAVKLTAGEAAMNAGAIAASVAIMYSTRLPFAYVRLHAPYESGTSYRVKDNVDKSELKKES